MGFQASYRGWGLAKSPDDKIYGSKISPKFLENLRFTFLGWFDGDKETFISFRSFSVKEHN
jgi:hypothetical protein